MSAQYQERSPNADRSLYETNRMIERCTKCPGTCSCDLGSRSNYDRMQFAAYVLNENVLQKLPLVKQPGVRGEGYEAPSDSVWCSTSRGDFWDAEGSFGVGGDISAAEYCQLKLAQGWKVGECVENILASPRDKISLCSADRTSVDDQVEIPEPCTGPTPGPSPGPTPHQNCTHQCKTNPSYSPPLCCKNPDPSQSWVCKCPRDPTKPQCP